MRSGSAHRPQLCGAAPQACRHSTGRARVGARLRSGRRSAVGHGRRAITPVGRARWSPPCHTGPAASHGLRRALTRASAPTRRRGLRAWVRLDPSPPEGSSRAAANPPVRWSLLLLPSGGLGRDGSWSSARTSAGGSPPAGGGAWCCRSRRQAAVLIRASARVVDWSRWTHSVLTVELPASAAALPEAGSHQAQDWTTTRQSHRLVYAAEVYPAVSTGRRYTFVSWTFCGGCGESAAGGAGVPQADALAGRLSVACREDRVGCWRPIARGPGSRCLRGWGRGGFAMPAGESVPCSDRRRDGVPPSGVADHG